MRLRHHASSVPALEKILTPVMEGDDLVIYSDDDDDEVNIISASLSSGNTTLERRRIHSLTKDDSLGFGGDTDELDHDNVFHSRTPSSLSNKSGRKLLSRSEDNLLNEKPGEQSDTFKEDISSLLQNESMESIDSDGYKPDMTMLFGSSNMPSPFFQRGRGIAAQPLRQYSEGNIKTDPSFSIGTPPLLSPSSPKSSGKTASSHGSVSDTTSEEPIMERSFEQDHSLKRNNSMKRGTRRELYSLRKAEGLTDSGGDYPLAVFVDEEDSQSNEDIPLPDDSTHITEPLKVNHIVHRYSSSRDSGLSDSPDPMLELGSPANNPVSSRALTDRLHTSMMEREGKPSPLATEHVRLKKPSPEKRCRSDGAIQPITRHLTKVLKVTPSIDLGLTSSSTSPPEGGTDGIPIQRLRMASPEELLSPEEELPNLDIKRSKSHYGGLFHSKNNEEEETDRRVGEFIVSEAKITRKASRVLSLNSLPSSKSLESLR